jgi:outer membrane receptor protein involved in Fe transport
MRARLVSWKLAAGLALLLAAPFGQAGAHAQTSTASLRGTVLDVTGTAIGAATLTATNKETGFQHSATAQENGFYNLTLPPGTYDVKVTAGAHEPQTETLRLQVGQVISKDFRLSPSETVSEVMNVEAAAPEAETRTSEVATNVAREQIENLPQNNRNFLNFAALAPGVRVSDNEFRKEISSGASEARETNIFIDGASYKNDVLEGGAVGQDASRGNPFPQNAVQEFRVLTQNYKAEYEKASSAIISAITKSGSNRLRGNAFVFYQNKSLVEQDSFSKERGEEKPDYKRLQTGLDFGGPIFTDRLHYFLSYEGNRQDRANAVTLGNTSSPIAPQLQSQVGSFVSPFRETLFFGKLSYQPSGGQQLFDLSANNRHETDVRDFGGQTAFESADNVKEDIRALVAKHQYTASRWYNEAILHYQWYNWNPVPTNPNLPGRNYFGVLRLGGRDTTQDFTQEKIALRDDVTLTGLTWHGEHVAKIGANFVNAKYKVRKDFDANPVFNFRSDISLDFPFEAQFGVGNPNLDANNNQFGLYLQDDWAATPRLTFNLGIRWDYESNMLNNNYKTPADVRQNLAAIVPSRYFTDGNDRNPYTSAIQPRLGFSYDLTGDGTTVAFGGWGRYYDRTLYNHTLDERFRLQYAVRTFRFSLDGAPRDGQPTIPWRPEYLSTTGLLGLIASGVAPNPEVFLIDNNTKPEHADQWSFGVRHQFHSFLASLNYTNIHSYNGFTWIFGTRRPDGSCCLSVNNYANILLSDANKETKYDGVFLTLDRPYTSAAHWGASLSYTYGKGKQNGGDLFSLDFPRVKDYPFYPVNNDQRHTLIMTGIVGLPWDLRLSTFINLGSGTPYNISDASRGFGPNEFVFRRNAGEPEKFSFIIPNAWAYRSVDLRLQKDIHLGNVRLGLIAEGFNVFGYKNFKDYNGFIAPTSGPPNPDFGKPSAQIDPGRRLQFGLSVSL